MINRDILIRILTPSWYGGLLALILTTVIVGYMVVPSLYAGSQFYQYFSSSDYADAKLTRDFQSVNIAVNTSSFSGDAAIFVIWSLVGLALYYIVLSLLRVGTNTVTFFEILEYFKRDREAIEREALIKLSVRLCGLLSLFVLYRFMMSYVLPYALIFSAKALESSPLLATGYVVAIAGSILLTIHIGVVLLRVILLRPRVFRASY